MLILSLDGCNSEDSMLLPVAWVFLPYSLAGLLVGSAISYLMGSSGFCVDGGSFLGNLACALELVADFQSTPLLLMSDVLSSDCSVSTDSWLIVLYFCCTTSSHALLRPAND